MFIPAMKQILNIALKYQLSNINSYDGYDDADILKIEFVDLQELLKFRDFLKSHKIQYKITVQNPKTIYCIFERSSDNSTYSLK